MVLKDDRQGTITDIDGGFDLNPAVPKTISIDRARNQLDRMIKRGARAPFTEIMVIDPPMAHAMLEHNATDDWRNRPEKTHAITRYAKAMRDGRFQFTGESLSFSSCGKMLNGQNRSRACTIAKKSFTAVVAFGIDLESFKFMDGGVTRKYADIFFIDGIKNWDLASRVTHWIVRIREHNGFNPSPSQRPENDQLLAYYKTLPDLQESFWIARLHAKEGEALANGNMLNALYYLTPDESKPRAEIFYRRLITGVGIEKSNSPENVIRKWLRADNRKRPNQTGDVYRAAYIVKAWNAFHTGRKISRFSWRTESNPNAPFPTIR